MGLEAGNRHGDCPFLILSLCQVSGKPPDSRKFDQWDGNPYAVRVSSVSDRMWGWILRNRNVPSFNE